METGNQTSVIPAESINTQLPLLLLPAQRVDHLNRGGERLLQVFLEGGMKRRGGGGEGRRGDSIFNWSH